MRLDNKNITSSRSPIVLLTVILTIIWFGTCPAGDAGRVNLLTHLGVGARAIGLNNAFTAACTDYTAAVWNPAAMGFFTTVKFGGMQSKMSLNRELMFFSVSLPTETWGAFAMSWAEFAVNEIEARLSNTLEPDRYFGAQEQTLLLTYAYNLLPVLAVGSNIKIYHFNLERLSAWGTGVDLAFFLIPWQKLRLGFVSENMDGIVLWSSGHTERYERAYRFGCAVYPTSNIIVSCDFQRTEQGQQRLTFGSELVLLNLLKFRCGYNQQRWSLGSGVTLPIKSTFVTFNYAIASDNIEAGLLDVFDLSIAF